MWNKLMKWLRKSKDDERYDLYKPGERVIYEYFDGEKQVKQDPMVLYKRMMDEGPELAQCITVASSNTKWAAKSHQEMIDRIRKIFAIKVPFDSGGLTELELIDLFNHFMIYCQRVKKNSNMFPTSPAETSPITKPSPAESLPTTKPSESGSTEGVSNTEQPMPLQPESVSPSDSSPPA